MIARVLYSAKGWFAFYDVQEIDSDGKHLRIWSDGHALTIFDMNKVREIALEESRCRD